MKIVNVIPITQGVLKEVLTYYTSKDAEKNSLVMVPLRGKSVPGLVVSAEDANEAKTRLRTSRFTLKRVERVAERNFLLPEFISAAEETARYFACTSGGIIADLVPSRIFEEYLKFKGDLTPLLSKENIGKKRIHQPENLKNVDKYAVQANDEDRFSVYRGIIREEFAKSSSVFISCPTTMSVETVFRELGRGIEQYTFFLHGKMTPKEMLAKWKTILETTHPVLIIGTPSFSSIPRADFGAFIVEQESRDAYHAISRPYFDFRYFLERYAEKMSARFIVGDFFLRVETLRQHELRNFSAIIPLRFRLLSTLEQAIVDMKKEKADGPKENGFRVISEKLRKAIETTLSSGGNVFLFGVRRGLAPITACRDCGNVLSCSRCKIPYVLHREGKRNIFICHKCEERKKTEIMCPICGGWRLTALGVGVELTAEEARGMFPNTTVYELHSDIAKTDKKCTEIADAFNHSRGSILVGTEFALPYVEKVSLSAVISVDTLFSLPDFRIQEKILRKLMEVKSKAEKTFIVQTRYATEKIFQSIIQGNLLEFYKNEIAERNRFFYPPFSIIIKIRFEGTDEDVANKAESLEKAFEKYSIKIFPAFIPKIRERYQVNAIIKVPTDQWPDPELFERILALPPYFKVKVDPPDLL
ncbi:MAG: hypothetical protein NT098_00830 [Candidatus Parcubacteria bacterium]|nr:hypothetical protein [Candidatus Parcubacteria bacterium]